MDSTLQSVIHDCPDNLRPADGTSYRVRITPVDDSDPLVPNGVSQEKVCTTWDGVWMFVYRSVVDEPLEAMDGDWESLEKTPLFFVVEIYGPDWFDDANLIWKGDCAPVHPVIASLHYECPARMLDHCRSFSRRYATAAIPGK